MDVGGWLRKLGLVQSRNSQPFDPENLRPSLLHFRQFA